MTTPFIPWYRWDLLTPADRMVRAFQSLTAAVLELRAELDAAKEQA